MSSKSDLESEDFDEVTLVSLEEIQPSRDNQVVVKFIEELPIEIEGCTDDAYIQYLDDDDSNIGSMVSITSEPISMEHSYSEKYIVPDPLQELAMEIQKREAEKPQPKITPTDSWPTLEILPGGVIRHAETTDDLTSSGEEAVTNNPGLENMYACAQCPKSFRDLYALVKHVRFHEDEKRLCLSNLSKLNAETVKSNWCALKQTQKKKVNVKKHSIEKKIPKRRKI